ncbi:hypothetical protein E2C01_058914 [Portunus trituberculatus]|uniref:Uncharacterized protein n=1 Tax=Portunus trituberculatus TaxID=210409 RepID=A0A5B7H407_PORTR|nr:hypothetical protein [Portunus trituberculatus]
MFPRFLLRCSLPNPLLENRSTKLSKIMLLASSASSPPSRPPSLPLLASPPCSRHALATPQSTQALEASWKNCLGLLEGEKNTPVRECRGNSSFRDDGKVFASAIVKACEGHVIMLSHVACNAAGSCRTGGALMRRLLP